MLDSAPIWRAGARFVGYARFAPLATSAGTDPTELSFVRAPGTTPPAATFDPLTITASAPGAGARTAVVTASALGELAHLTTTGASARPYEDEICVRDGTGRITYRIEHVARAGATGALVRDAIGGATSARAIDC